MKVGERIKNRRIELGISQDELAQKLGYKDRSTISYIEKGGENLPISKVKEIADALGVSPGYLMGWDDQEAVEPSLDTVLQRAFSDRPDLRLLFSAAKDASPEDIQTAIKIISALKDK